jgi:hypothetical protein
MYGAILTVVRATKQVIGNSVFFFPENSNENAAKHNNIVRRWLHYEGNSNLPFRVWSRKLFLVSLN